MPRLRPARRRVRVWDATLQRVSSKPGRRARRHGPMQKTAEHRAETARATRTRAAERRSRTRASNSSELVGVPDDLDFGDFFAVGGDGEHAVEPPAEEADDR